MELKMVIKIYSTKVRNGSLEENTKSKFPDQIYMLAGGVDKDKCSKEEFENIVLCSMIQDISNFNMY